MSSNIDTLIRKVLLNEATHDEKLLFDKWLNASSENRFVFQNVQKIWEEKWTGGKVINENEVFEKIWKRSATLERHNEHFHKKWDFNYLLKIAATILILLIPLYFFGKFIFIKNLSNDQIISKVIIKENPKGQKLRVFLPDGSTVWLNSESSIQYEDEFNDSIRIVELQGEGFFEVFSDKSKPFIVKSGEVSTTALGTSFNIQAYPDEDKTEITLVSGKVKVNALDTNRVFYLEPYSGLTYDRESHGFEAFTASIDDVLAWKDGILVFNGDDFYSVTKKLERWYGISVSVAGYPPDNWNLTGRFNNDHLVDVLETIKFSRSFEYKLNKKLLEINF